MIVVERICIALLTIFLKFIFANTYRLSMSAKIYLNEVFHPLRAALFLIVKDEKEKRSTNTDSQIRVEPLLFNESSE